MYYSNTIFVVLVCLFNTYGVSYGTFVEDYCWRDYNGIAPSDALQGGVDRNGNPIYIGQVLFDNKLIPGKIHENTNEIHFEFKYAYTVNESIKVLCTKHPERFQWVPTHSYAVMDMQDKHIFVGGYEEGFITYIGRAYSHDETTVGKVICWDKEVGRGCIKLTTIENGTWYDHEDFEILTYNPMANVIATTIQTNSITELSTTTSATTSTREASTVNLKTLKYGVAPNKEFSSKPFPVIVLLCTSYLSLARILHPQ